MLEDAAGIRRVVFACITVDLRKGIDGLATIIGDKYGQNSFEKGTLFLFCGKRFDWCKGLLWIKVYVGINGRHQDKFLRGDHPTTLFKGSIAIPSLEAAVINAKYINSNLLDRIVRDFQANGLNLSKQTMSSWTVWLAERYFLLQYEWMKKRQFEVCVNQCNETPLEVIHDGISAGSKGYIWVHLTGEFNPVPKIILYEYQKAGHSDHPKGYYKNFTGFLMTDGLEQYHKLERNLKGVINANYMAHARPYFANAIKVLVRIGAIYDLVGALKDLIMEECLKERQASFKPLVEEFFGQICEPLADQKVLQKGETAQGLNYCLNQEKYLKVFLTDGEVPIDDSASKRALRNFTIGRKNWVAINKVWRAQASAVIYSFIEIARANNLNVYYYLKYLLTELPQLIYANGKIEESSLEPFMPWSKTFPADCYSKCRK